MSIPNSPLLPGSKLEQAAKSKSTFSIAAFIFSAHVAVFLVVLLNGCNKESAPTTPETASSAPTNQTDLAVQPVGTAGDTNLALVPPTGGAPATNSTGIGGGPVTYPGAPTLLSNVPPTQPPPDLGGGPGGQAPEAPGSGSEYKVKSGDIAYNIAKSHGISLKALKDANPSVDLGKLKVGQTLQVPAGSATAAHGSGSTAPKSEAATESAATPGATTAYTVKGGDTLGKIAKKFGTSPKAIRAANSLSGDKINVGQKLKIPAKGAAAEGSADKAEPAAKVPTKAPADPLPGATIPALPPGGSGR